MRLKDRTAIVTGGAQGIGFGIARRYTTEGAAVVIADVDSEGAARAAAMLMSLGGRARAEPTDVSRPADVTRLIQETVNAFGRLDNLVTPQAGPARPGRGARGCRGRAVFLASEDAVFVHGAVLTVDGGYLAG